MDQLLNIERGLLAHMATSKVPKGTLGERLQELALEHYDPNDRDEQLVGLGELDGREEQ